MPQYFLFLFSLFHADSLRSNFHFFSFLSTAQISLPLLSQFGSEEPCKLDAFLMRKLQGYLYNFGYDISVIVAQNK